MRKNMYTPERLEETEEQLNNPFRGWYRIVYYMAQENPDYLLEEYDKSRKYLLELVIINISAFRDSEISADGLEHIRRILEHYREKKISVILRIVYDHEGKAAEREPFFFDTVCRHIQQIGAVIKPYVDIILVYQGLLIGNWGEMHSSRFLQKDKLQQLSQLFSESTDNHIPYAVRRPSQWRALRDNNQMQQGELGLFDDAMMGSENHMGTFGSGNEKSAGWEASWDIEEELLFEKEIAKYVPNGGELVAPKNVTEVTSESVISRLQKMGITYLNADYDRKILDRIDNPEDLEKHLGYRYYVAESFVEREWKRSGKKVLHIRMVNTGFAGIYRKASVYLEWSVLGGTENRLCIVENVMEKNGQADWECVIPLDKLGQKLSGNLYLYMQLENGQMIRLANPSDSRGRVRLGCFHS